MQSLAHPETGLYPQRVLSACHWWRGTVAYKMALG